MSKKSPKIENQLGKQSSNSSNEEDGDEKMVYKISNSTTIRLDLAFGRGKREMEDDVRKGLIEYPHPPTSRA